VSNGVDDACRRSEATRVARRVHCGAVAGVVVPSTAGAAVLLNLRLAVFLDLVLAVGGHRVLLLDVSGKGNGGIAVVELVD